MPDSIIEELHKIRRAIAEEHNWDLESIFRQLQEQERKSEHRVVSLPSQKPTTIKPSDH